MKVYVQTYATYPAPLIAPAACMVSLEARVGKNKFRRFSHL